MRKVINGKVYDTSTAKLSGISSNASAVTDFTYCEERLYRKKTGEYFLHGFGGPTSKYAVHENDRWSGGEQIIPLSINAAMDWAERELSGEEYESLFGEIVEDDEKKVVTFSLSNASVERLSRYSSTSGDTKSSIIESLIDKYLK